MTEYAICFDFPERDEPWFAAQLRSDGLGWTASLSGALLFDTEEAAERMLENGYGAAARHWGAVVEVGQPNG